MTQKLFLKAEITSPALPASGEGFGAVVDTDVVFDGFGMPYLPARRIKGVLKEAALEVLEMLNGAKIDKIPGLGDACGRVFGLAGQRRGASYQFCTMFIEDYKNIRAWLDWSMVKYCNILSSQVLLDMFTCIRQQTSLGEDGVAEDGSLRTIRVLKPNLKFEGSINRDYGDESTAEIIAEEKLLALACAQARRIGSMRNRGFGEIEFSLWKNNTDLTASVLKEIKN